MSTQIEDFLKEDLGKGDITTNVVVPENHHSKAAIIAKAEGIVAGHPFAKEVFQSLDPDTFYQELKQDGERVTRGDLLANLSGKTRAILTGERVALNLLQRLSGIATLTRRFVDAVEGTGVIILDTRKTSPGLRKMERYAVQSGGGKNHRFNLSEMALIKDNHIAVAGSVREAIERVRSHVTIPIEVEVKNMEELKEALECPVERIMLDNWEIESIPKAVSMVNGRKPLEVSGNMTPEKAKAIARTGINFISVGALTHSFQALDISLLMENAKQ